MLAEGSINTHMTHLYIAMEVVIIRTPNLQVFTSHMLTSKTMLFAEIENITTFHKANSRES